MPPIHKQNTWPLTFQAWYRNFEENWRGYIPNTLLHDLSLCGLGTGVTYSFPPILISPLRKNEYILSFPLRKNEYILRFPPGKLVYTEFSPRKTKYVLTHTHFFLHTSFSPFPILIGFFLCTLLYMYMVEDIIVKCGRKRVSTMMIITKASMNMEWERIRK
jgi:hypothetical protein